MVPLFFGFTPDGIPPQTPRVRDFLLPGRAGDQVRQYPREEAERIGRLLSGEGTSIGSKVAGLAYASVGRVVRTSDTLANVRS